RYGIVTPYTSFLMTDDVVGAKPGELASNARERLATLNGLGGLGGGGLAPGEPQAESVRAAKDFADGRRANEKGKANDLDRAADDAFREAGRGESSLAALRYIGSKTFYNRADEWYEGEFDPEKDKDVKTVEVGSDEYFKLVRENKGLAKYLALENVTVRVGKDWYRFESRRKRG
ncbi:MAG: hypothetical protein WD069_16775, partial [Planctomycetales bacterium]